jgi:hypothetical protein
MLLLAVGVWRSRLSINADGVSWRFLATRHVAWSRIEALDAAGSGLRGPHLRVRSGAPISLNPYWSVHGEERLTVAHDGRGPKKCPLRAR